VIENLPNKHKTLSSNHSTAKKKKMDKARYTKTKLSFRPASESHVGENQIVSKEV
jgi:hypothetical protein